MTTPRHKGGTRTFEQLDFAEQAKSISASLIYIQRAIDANCRHPRASANTRDRRVAQVRRLVARLTPASI